MDGVFKEEIELGRKEEEEEAERDLAQEESQPKDIESEGKVTNAKLRIIFGLTEGEALWSESSRGEEKGNDEVASLTGSRLHFFSSLTGTPCGLQRSIIPLRGHLIISPRYIGFFRKTIAGHE